MTSELIKLVGARIVEAYVEMRKDRGHKLTPRRRTCPTRWQEIDTTVPSKGVRNRTPSRLAEIERPRRRQRYPSRIRNAKSGGFGHVTPKLQTLEKQAEAGLVRSRGVGGYGQGQKTVEQFYASPHTNSRIDGNQVRTPT